MAAGVTCPRCGTANKPGFTFCANCGSPLAAGAAPSAPAAPTYPAAAPMSAYGAPMGYLGPPSPYEAERRKQIDRTKTGLLPLLVGGLLSWIPIIQFIGALLSLIGAILVILGRKAFGAMHARNVVLAIVLVFVAIIVGAVFGAIFAFTILSATAQTSQAAAAAIASAFNTFLLGLIVVAAISGLSSVLFTYALQQQTGRILLWAGYGANLVLTIAIYAIISPLVASAVASAISGSTYDPAPIQALQNQLTGLGFLSAIPALLFAAATYLAWSRVNRGEIPPPTTPPGMPVGPSAAWPPTPPTGPAPPINPQ